MQSLLIDSLVDRTSVDVAIGPWSHHWKYKLYSKVKQIVTVWKILHYIHPWYFIYSLTSKNICTCSTPRLPKDARLGTRIIPLKMKHLWLSKILCPFVEVLCNALDELKLKFLILRFVVVFERKDTFLTKVCHTSFLFNVGCWMLKKK